MPEKHAHQKPSKGAVDADPFDLVTGIYSREYPDLHVDDSIPLDLVRTQRNMDPKSRAFGIGASTSYDLYIIGDAQKFSWVALVDANGSQMHYTRITPGTSFAEAVFKDTTSPDRIPGFNHLLEQTQYMDGKTAQWHGIHHSKLFTGEQTRTMRRN